MNSKYYCRNCKGKRLHKVIAEKKQKGSDEMDYHMWSDEYFIIECLGCETISFLRIYGDSEMYTYDEAGDPGYYVDETIYPIVVEDLREIESTYYIPPAISIIYKETIDTFKTGALILTAGGLRAIIEAICNHLKIKKDDLSKRIDLLFEKGFISLKESRRLHSIRFLGNDALHEIEKPKDYQLHILFEIINHLLENLFIHDKKMERNIDVMIDSYERFILNLKNRVNKELVGKELTLAQILGKSKRLLKPADLKKYELQLIKALDGKEIDFLSVAKKSDPIIYKLEKESDFSFFL